MKTKEDRVGEKMGGDFYKLGLGKGSAEIVVGQVDRPEESVARHDRVEKKVDTGERQRERRGGRKTRGGHLRRCRERDGPRRR